MYPILRCLVPTHYFFSDECKKMLHSGVTDSILKKDLFFTQLVYLIKWVPNQIFPNGPVLYLCREMLVQATDENKRTLKAALANVKGDNVANFTGALATAFEILHKVC
jgi:hypothetical protein